MRIYLLRHGQAEPQVSTDDLRQLTPKGRADTKHILRLAVEHMPELDAIWASPLVRAQQTALIANSFFPHLGVQTTPLLIPEAPPQPVYGWLAGLPEYKSLLLVGHQPLIGTLLNQFCGVPNGYYAMGTSSLAALDMEVVGAGLAQLRWLHHV